MVVSSPLNVVWSRIQNLIGLSLILFFFTLPNPRFVFISLALWIFTSTVVTALLQKTRFTLANIITLSRAFGLVTCSVILAHNGYISNLSVFILGICLLADALDGYLARLFTTSSAGKILDGETDQQFVLLTASACYILLHMPFWLLFFPCIKYIFGIFYELFKLSVRENSGEKRRKIIAAIVMIILFINLTSLINEETGVLISSFGFLLLSYSFIADLIRSIQTKLRNEPQ